ncbi:hypothetical protein I350_03601 [Cryptococcus amylolentus CBS 6273]|uniref:Uncharacterized protein n=1 Tax=Cryptococcus amylolentus CBS 6273 TaxID=1296118 RepID=A0A1E3K447_9TREE|nr:hypothetical protein I350_03601 [Cryptococcus amylolentus CBS 6273]
MSPERLSERAPTLITREPAKILLSVPPQGQPVYGAAVGHHASNTHDLNTHNRSTTSSDPTSTQAPEQSHEGGGSNGLGTHAAECSGARMTRLIIALCPEINPDQGTRVKVYLEVRVLQAKESPPRRSASNYERSTTEGPITGGAANTGRFDTDKSSSSHVDKQMMICNLISMLGDVMKK